MRAVLLGVALALAAGATPAQRGEESLEDVLQIVVVPRRVLSIDAESGGQREIALERNEEVHWKLARGRVGVALTNQRILAVASGSAAWQEARLRGDEQVLGKPRLGQRVALIETPLRVLGFDGHTGNLVESSLGVRESVVSRAVGANVAVAVTDRRALGVTPFRGGFFQVPLQPGEKLQSVEAVSNLATVTTNRRLLTFDATTGFWGERRLGLGN